MNMADASVLGWFLNLTLLGLLAACLVFCWRLDRKLSHLRNGQDGLREAAQELIEASRHAETAVRNLRLTANEAGHALQSRIDEARTLSDRGGPIPPSRPQRQNRETRW
jgi:hypothetical protein